MLERNRRVIAEKGVLPTPGVTRTYSKPWYLDALRSDGIGGDRRKTGVVLQPLSYRVTVTAHPLGQIVRRSTPLFKKIISTMRNE